MKTLRDLKVDDTVLMTDANNYYWNKGVKITPPPREIRVVKVGRKLLHVANDAWAPRKFNLDTGVEEGQGINTGHVYTHDQWAGRAERLDVLKRLSAVGLRPEVHGSAFERIPTEKLRDVLSILEV